MHGTHLNKGRAFHIGDNNMHSQTAAGGWMEAPAVEGSSWSSFWVQRVEAKQTGCMCTNPAPSAPPPITGAPLKRHNYLGRNPSFIRTNPQLA